MSLLPRRHLLAALPGLALGRVGLANAPLPARVLAFPRDHGSHDELRTEWWYITGAVRAGERQFGVQITFFRTRPDVPAAGDGRFALRQLLFAHAAITDLKGRRLWHDERIARWNGDPRSAAAAASSEDLAVHIRDWSLRRASSAPDAPYLARIRGGSFSLTLDFNPTQAVLLQGERGLSRKGPKPEQASYYYSHPQLATRGELVLHGERHEVQGSAWLDHEWSESVLDPQAVGWDWIGMNLDDGHALTAFQLRRRDGSRLWAGGSFRRGSDGARPEAIYRFAAGEVEFSARRHWTSPTTRARYPVEWLIRTPADFYTVRARLDPQELDARGSTGTVYWEGLSDLLDSNGRLVGRGYLEMTGYASPLRL